MSAAPDLGGGARGSAGVTVTVAAQRGVRGPPPGAPLQAAPEPQQQDPRPWAWPGAREAAEPRTAGGTLPRAPGDPCPEGADGDPCPEAPGDRYSVISDCGWVLEETKVNFPAVTFRTENPEMRAV